MDGCSRCFIMHEDFEESLVAISLPKFIDLILNHSQYQKPYEENKGKKKNMSKARGLGLLVREKKFIRRKGRHSKSPNKKIQQKKI